MQIIVEYAPVPGLLVDDMNVTCFLADVLQEFIDSNPHLADYGIKIRVEDVVGDLPSNLARADTTIAHDIVCLSQT